MLIDSETSFVAMGTGVDRRHCAFVDCEFTDAIVDGVKLARVVRESLALSPERHVIALCADDGAKPDRE